MAYTYYASWGVRFLWSGLGLGGAVLGIGFFFFLNEVSFAPPDSPMPKSVQAVVILTGDGGRVNWGLTLMKEENLKKGFISGIPFRGEKLSGMRERGLDLGAASNTVENAQEVAAWIEKNHITSIALVTSFYHMPRAQKEIKRLSDVHIYPYPLPPRDRPWWASFSTWRILIQEYFKMLRFYIRTPPYFSGKEEKEK